MTIFHQWHPIEDLPEDWRSLTDGELDSLLLVWKDQQERLQQEGLLQEVLGSINREWAIETGVIEGAYTLDRGVTETLIRSGLSPSLIPPDATNLDPERLAAILEDQGAALEMVFAFVKGDRQLSVSFIKELHAAFLRNMDTYTARDALGRVFEAQLDKGAFKKLPNTVTRPDGTIHQYAPPEQVDSEMDRLIDLANGLAERGIPPEIHAAWLHHRFTQIHPFQDGNGRVARALASAVFVKSGWFAFSVHRDDQAQYWTALVAADKGDLRSLVTFFSRVQRKTMNTVLEHAVKAYPPVGFQDALALLKAKQRSSEASYSSRYERVRLLQRDLVGLVGWELAAAAQGITRSLEVSGSHSRSVKEAPAKLLEMLPLISDLQALALSLDEASSLWLVFGAPKPEFTGIIDIWPAYCTASENFDLLAPQPFSFNYRDEFLAVQERLKKWLSPIIGAAVLRWGGPSNTSHPK